MQPAAGDFAPDPGTAPVRPAGDAETLARGGRTNVLGFGLRLAARLPFLFIAGRLYGAELLGGFAYATLVVELAAAIATLGLRRGLAQALTQRGERPESHVVADALLLALLLSAVASGILIAFPGLLFPSVPLTPFSRVFPLVVIAIALSDVSLAALAFRHRIAPTVTARSLVEPWVLTIVGTALVFTAWKPDGLLIGYMVSLVAAAVWSLVPCFREFRVATGWRPDMRRLRQLTADNAPLAVADLADWASRRLDLFILGFFATPAVLGVYWVAQQVASLPQKLKTSFDPILAPLLTAAMARGDRASMAADVRQVGFWILMAQLGLVWAGGLTGEGTLGTVGPEFASGALVLAFLFIAEIFAGQASVAESALVYLRPKHNLWLSAIGLAVQAAVTFLLVREFGAVGAAGGLALAMLVVMLLKARAMRQMVDERVTGWRWTVLLASLPTVAIGLGFRQTPEPVMMLVGIPLMFVTYFACAWFIAFRGPDRALFTAKKRR